MKSINEYKLIILDMDGTLYFQKPLRIHMTFDLLGYYLVHFYKIKELFILKKYRNIREEKSLITGNNFVNEQYKIVAKRFNTSEEYIRKIINYWMYDKPLKYIKKFADSHLIDIINKVKENGCKIVIYSDYPVNKKINMLSLKYDLIFSSIDKEILCLKPNPKGLNYILNTVDIDKNDALFIGDRFEKDGECAKNCGIDFFILNSNSKKRFKQIEEYLDEIYK